jgi:hypothetical protein
MIVSGTGCRGRDAFAAIEMMRATASRQLGEFRRAVPLNEIYVEGGGILPGVRDAANRSSASPGEYKAHRCVSLCWATPAGADTWISASSIFTTASPTASSIAAISWIG